MSEQTMTLDVLSKAVGGDGVAVRCRRRLQPAGGAGTKCFPSTYEGGRYATEDRILDGVRTPCVLLDSVQSQANRIEQALKAAFYRAGAKKADIPVIGVDFASKGLPEVGWITSLDAPHRIADAILRDSLNGKCKFRDSDEGKAFTNASMEDATALFRLCPTALLLGMWDSTGPKGGMGSKFQRAMVSEIVAVNAVTGVKTSSRIDPLNIAATAGPVYKSKDGGWTLDATDKKAEKVGKDGKPSEINHGNVAPTIADCGGVTMDYALQTTVISLAALRRLRFSSTKGDVSTAAQTVLAALGICGAVLAQADADLRSRCLLIPEGSAIWEILGSTGTSSSFEVNATCAKALLMQAISQADKAGIGWRTEVLVLTPSAPFIELVKRSRVIQTSQPAEG